MWEMPWAVLSLLTDTEQHRLGKADLLNWY